MERVDTQPTLGLEAERAVLGAMLIDESIVSQVLAEVDERDFSGTSYRLIFQAAREVLREGGHPDAVTINAKLGYASGSPQQQQLIDLMEVTPTSASWREYAQLMREQAAVRRIHALMAQGCGEPTLDALRPLISEMQSQMTSRRGVKVVPMLELLQDFSTRHASGAAADYVGFGLEVLDKNSFIRAGDVVVLGGYPSDGKTALALMMAYHMAKTRKVGFFSLETSAEKIGDRVVTQGMRIDFDAIKRSRLTDRDWGTFAVCSEDAAKRRLDVIQASGMTAGDIMAEAVTYGYDVIFVDYVQLVVPEGNPRDLRSEQMATVSRALHTFAQSRGVLVVELAQLSRPERGAWRAPDMHDLKETGQFEQDADLIVMVYRPDPKSNYSQEKCRVIQIAKSKEGRRGSGVFAFDGKHQTFAPYTRDDERGRKEKQGGEAPGQVTLEELPEDKSAPF